MPRWLALRPRQILPPPMTMATSTPMECTSWISPQSWPTISGEILSAEPLALSASPLSLRTIRRYLGLDLALDGDLVREGAAGIEPTEWRGGPVLSSLLIGNR